jgi:hypothetical protein
MSSSDRAGGSARWRGLGQAAALAMALHAGGCAAPGPPANGAGAAELARLAGEHGLWVQERDGRVQVAWITAADGPGMLEVSGAAGERVFSSSTRRGPAHRASFPASGRDELILHYGARDDAGDRHRTRIRLGDPPRAPFDVPLADTLFVVGDTHGLYDRLVTVLRHAGVVDGELGWSGGRAHFVVLGDIFDRGEDVHAILWLLYRLEEEARRAGGAVHVVLGNHELLALTDQREYVAAKELRVAELHRAGYAQLFDTRYSVLGRWLRSKPGVMRAGDLVLAHGGLAPPYSEWPLAEVNDSLAAFMSEPLFHYLSGDRSVPVAPLDSVAEDRRLEMFYTAASPLWHRGYVQSDTLAEQLGAMLARHRARRHVVAHTPVPRILTRYDGALIAVQPVRAASEVLRVTGAAGQRLYEVVDEGGAWRRLGPE